jgi:hypothetical protein
MGKLFHFGSRISNGISYDGHDAGNEKKKVNDMTCFFGQMTWKLFYRYDNGNKVGNIQHTWCGYMVLADIVGDGQMVLDWPWHRRC